MALWVNSQLVALLQIRLTADIDYSPPPVDFKCRLLVAQVDTVGLVLPVVAMAGPELKEFVHDSLASRFPQSLQHAETATG